MSDYNCHDDWLKRYAREMENPKYSIEAHGDGYALYFGRSTFHHGANIAHLTEISQQTRTLIVTALNQMIGK